MKNGKNYVSFRIPKIWQILKRFANHFIKHKPLISEEWPTYIPSVNKQLTLFYPTKIDAILLHVCEQNKLNKQDKTEYWEWRETQTIELWLIWMNCYSTTAYLLIRKFTKPLKLCTYSLEWSNYPSCHRKAKSKK